MKNPRPESDAVIAIVDDDPSVRKGLERLIRSAGNGVGEPASMRFRDPPDGEHPGSQRRRGTSVPDGNWCLTLLPRAGGRRARFDWRAISQVVVSLLLAFTAIDAAPPPASRSVQSVRLPIIEGRDIRFTHLSTEQGLSQSRVDHILQDAQGFMWVGTYNGLNRYDGYRFKVYKPEANNPNSIGGVFITALFQDRSGALWIGVDQGLDRFDPATETFTHFLSNPGERASLAGHVEHMTQDRDGILWLATRNGLDRLDPATARFTHYRNDPNNPRSLSSNDVRFVFEDRQGTLWVATATDLNALDRATGNVTRYPNCFEGPLDRIFEDRSGLLWVSSTRAGGFASLDRQTGRFTRYTFFEEGTVRGCMAILEDQYGMLWLACSPDGVLRFDRQGQQLTRYRNDPSDPASLSNNHALSLAEDREGGIWVGTDGGGVNRFPSKSSPFTIFRKEPGNPNSLDQSFALSVFEDSQGILWIGTGQLNRLDRKTGKYTFFRPRPDDSGSIANGTVYAIAEDHAGVLWFGTWGGGLNRFDRRTGRFKAYRHKPEESGRLSHDRVLALLVDRAGTLWAGTEDGLNRFDPRTEHFTVYRDTGPPPSRIDRVITEGADGSIWFGTYEWGLQRLDPRTGKMVTYRHDPHLQGTLSNNRVNALCVDRSGQLWVGTQDGLDRYDPQTGKFAILNERDGLPSNAIQGILEDAVGNLWLSTGNGLSKFDPRTRTFKNYYTDDGLTGDEFNNFSVYYKSARGEMFFGGVNGVTAFFPERVTDSPYVPPVVLTELRLFGEPVPIGGNSPLRKSILFTDSLLLSHGQNIFSLEFSSLSYASPLRNRYRYKLVGLDKDWNEADSNHRFATYTTLPPSEYLFRVQGSNNRGVWNEKGVSLRIQILPPWWKTSWFRVGCLAALLGSLWGLYQLRVRELRREEQKFREAVETMPALAFIALPDGYRTFVNRRWVEYTGMAVEQATGSGWESAVHPDDLEMIIDKRQRLAARGEPVEYEMRLRRGADGQYRWFQTRLAPLRDKRGKLVKWCGVATDIEDRKRADQLQADLAHTNRVSLLGELTASIAHEVNQPLSGVVVNAGACMRWLARDIPNVEEAREAAQLIVRDGKRAGEIITRLRSLYKKDPPQRTLVDVNETIGEMIVMLRGEANRLGVSMRTDLATGLPKVTADRVQLQQVLMNLMLNAIEAMKETGGVLTVKSQRDQDGRVQVSVSDTGVGLPAEKADQIFNAFFTTKPQGSGMGLAISRSIVESHGGRLWATPNDGRGASFHFTLPNYHDEESKAAV